MKLKFTRASKKDKALVTIRVSELEKLYTGQVFNLQQGSMYVLFVEGIPTVFIVNRQDGSTLSTKTFPRELKLPRVGKPIYAEVDEDVRNVREY